MKAIVALSIIMAASAMGLPSPSIQAAERKYSYQINKTWNGTDVPANEVVDIVLYGVKEGMVVEISAPFYNDKAPEGDRGRFDELWNYEVVELFILGEEEQYLELEFGPHGHYLVYELEGYRNVVKNDSTLTSYEATINAAAKTWSGRAVVPFNYLPEPIPSNSSSSEPATNSFNAYAIHKEEEPRAYMALFPNTDASAAGPDFHDLEWFEPIDLSEVKKGLGAGAGTVIIQHWIQFSLIFVLISCVFA